MCLYNKKESPYVPFDYIFSYVVSVDKLHWKWEIAFERHMLWKIFLSIGCFLGLDGNCFILMFQALDIWNFLHLHSRIHRTCHKFQAHIWKSMLPASGGNF